MIGLFNNIRPSLNLAFPCTQVSPVTCSMKEITFFLSYMFNRGEGGSLILILKVISCIHDMVNGMVLEANADVTSHITKLINQSYT